MKDAFNQLTITAGKHCVYSTIYNVFKFYKYNLSESDIFFLFNGLGINYHQNEQLYAGYEHVNINFDRAVKSGIFDIEYSFYDDKEKYYKLIEEHLEKGNIVVIDTNTEDLRYDKVFEENINHQHFLIVYGIDRKNKTIDIGDCCLIGSNSEISTFKGRTSLEGIDKGIIGVINITKGENIAFSEEDLYKVVKDDIESYFSSNGYNEEGYCSGRFAISEYINSLNIAIEEEDEDKFYNLCINIYFTYKMAGLSHIGLYLEDFLTEHKLFNDDSILEDINKLNTKLNTISLAVMKSGIAFNKRKLSKLIEEYKEMLNVQDDLLKRVIEKINKKLNI